MRKTLIRGGLIAGLSLVVLALSPVPAAAYGGSSFGGGFHGGGGGFHVGGGFGFRVGSASPGFWGPGYHGSYFTFGFGAGQYPGPLRLGRGWLEQGHRRPVATPLPSHRWGYPAGPRQVRRIHRRHGYQYLACGPYPCASFGIGYFAPVESWTRPLDERRVRTPRYRGTGRYDRYRLE